MALAIMGVVRGHFPIPRSRRGLLIAGAALVVVLGGAAAGIALALTGTSGRGLTKASFPGYGFEFRYPAKWQREDWCWLGTSVFPLSLLTTSRNAPPCQPNLQFGSGTPLPPAQRVAKNGISAWLFASDAAKPPPGKPNATLDGQPARIDVRQVSTRRTQKSYVNCTTGPTQRILTAWIHAPSRNIGRIDVGAVICGPDFAAGLADVRKMLDSVRFTS